MTNPVQLQIVSITCNTPSENVGGDELNDEVYLICQKDGGAFLRYPAQLADSVNMTGGTLWTLGEPDLIMSFDYEALVTLWDCDVSLVPDVSTYLQSHDYEASDIRSKSVGDTWGVRVTNPNGADYTITAKVVAN